MSQVVHFPSSAVLWLHPNLGVKYNNYETAQVVPDDLANLIFVLVGLVFSWISSLIQLAVQLRGKC